MKVSFVKILALNKFLKSIDDEILREEVFECFQKLGSNPSPESMDELKKLLARADIPYSEYEKLIKQFKR